MCGCVTQINPGVGSVQQQSCAAAGIAAVAEDNFSPQPEQPYSEERFLSSGSEEVSNLFAHALQC